jgi:uncharacterized protein (DUF433 family)
MSEISRNPNVMSGSYCIRGTRIPVACIKGRYRAGDSVIYIAKDYHIPIRVVRECLKFRASVTKSRELKG